MLMKRLCMNLSFIFILAGGTVQSQVRPLVVDAGTDQTLEPNQPFVLQASVLNKEEHYSQTNSTPLSLGNSTSSIMEVSRAAADMKASGIVSLTVNIKVLRAADLRITLIAPDGSSTVVSEGYGLTGSNYENTTFSDESTVPISSAQPPYRGSFHPANSFSNTLKGPVNGTWRLRIVHKTLPSGMPIDTLKSWTLKFRNGVSFSWQPSAALNDSDKTRAIGIAKKSTLYTFTATDMHGFTASDSVKVFVVRKNAIIQQPADQYVLENARFSVRSLYEDNIAYQWYFNDNINGWQPVPHEFFYRGADSNTLEVLDCENRGAGRRFKCVVTDLMMDSSIESEEAACTYFAMSQGKGFEGGINRIGFLQEPEDMKRSRKQWQRLVTFPYEHWENLSDGSFFEGTDKAALTILQEERAYFHYIYRLTLTDETGYVSYGKELGVLSVESSPDFTRHAGESYQGHLDLNGWAGQHSTYTFLWEYHDGDSWKPLLPDHPDISANDLNFYIPLVRRYMNGYQFRCTVTDGATFAATTLPFKATVLFNTPQFRVDFVSPLCVGTSKFPSQKGISISVITNENDWGYTVQMEVDKGDGKGFVPAAPALSAADNNPVFDSVPVHFRLLTFANGNIVMYYELDYAGEENRDDLYRLKMIINKEVYYSEEVKLKFEDPYSVVEYPQDQAVQPGDTAEFRCLMEGSVLPLWEEFDGAAWNGVVSDSTHQLSYNSVYTGEYPGIASTLRVVAGKSRKDVTKFRVVSDIRCYTDAPTDTLPEVTLTVVKKGGQKRTGSFAAEKDTEIRVYPNPAKEKLGIRISVAENTVVSLQLLNLLGEPVKTEKVDLQQGEHSLEIPIAGLPAGVYLLEAGFGNSKERIKVVKEN
jgi:hypothetical protein